MTRRRPSRRPRPAPAPAPPTPAPSSMRESPEGPALRRHDRVGVLIAPARRGRGARLVLLTLLLALALGRLGAALLVVLLEGRQVLTGLGELALLHAIADVPVHERALGVHQVELVVDARVEL